MINKLFSVFLLPGGRIGVAIFFMITGYFSIVSNMLSVKKSVKKVVIETVFYSLLIQICAIVLKVGSVGNLIRGIIPLSTNSYWFVSTYVVLLMCTPFLNLFFNNLNRKQKQLVILFCWLFLYTIPYFFNTPYYSLERSIVYYFTGVFIRTEIKLEDIRLKRKRMMLLCTILWLMYIPIGNAFYMQTTYDSIILRILDGVAYNGIIVYGCSVALFLIFASLDSFTNIVINKIAKVTFGVYLIHDNMYRDFLWNDGVHITGLYQSRWFPVLALGIGVLIFTTTMIFDFGRDSLFKWVKCHCPRKIGSRDTLRIKASTNYHDKESG